MHLIHFLPRSCSSSSNEVWLAAVSDWSARQIWLLPLNLQESQRKSYFLVQDNSAVFPLSSNLQVLLLDGRGHLLGRLAAIVAKQVLLGKFNEKYNMWMLVDYRFLLKPCIVAITLFFEILNRIWSRSVYDDQFVYLSLTTMRKLTCTTIWDRTQIMISRVTGFCDAQMFFFFRSQSGGGEMRRHQHLRQLLPQQV